MKRRGAADLEALRQARREAVEVPFDAGVGGDEAFRHLCWVLAAVGRSLEAGVWGN